MPASLEDKGGVGGGEGKEPTLRRNMENLCLVKLKMFMRYPRGERDQLSSKDVVFSCGVDIIWEVKNYWRAHIIPESQPSSFQLQEFVHLCSAMTQWLPSNALPFF